MATDVETASTTLRAPATSIAAPGVVGAYRWYVLSLLAIIMGLAYLDRYLPFVLAEAVKKDLSLSDTELGLIGGMAFALFNTIFMLPVGRLADHKSRTGIIVISLALWSLATAAAGGARGFWHLFIARAGVGLGEAGCIAPAHSLVADYFPMHQRATAISILYVGTAAGVMLAFALGGWLSDGIGWRGVYLAFGLPGLAISLLAALTLRDPRRQHAAENTSTFGIAAAARTLISKPTLRRIVLAGSFIVIGSQSLSAWMSPLLIRVHGLSATEAGLAIGLPSGLAGGIGILTGGLLSDWSSRRDPRWYLWMPAAGVLLSVPAFALAIMAPSPELFLAAFVTALLLSMLYVGPTYAMVQNLAEPAQRATLAALVILIINLIGGAVGPPVLGLISDSLLPYMGARSLQAAMCAILAANVLSGLLYLRATQSLGTDLATVRGAR